MNRKEKYCDPDPVFGLTWLAWQGLVQLCNKPGILFFEAFLHISKLCYQSSISDFSNLLIGSVACSEDQLVCSSLELIQAIYQHNI